MDGNEKDIIVYALGVVGALGAAYITARWHVAVKGSDDKPGVGDSSSIDSNDTTPDIKP